MDLWILWIITFYMVSYFLFCSVLPLCLSYILWPGAMVYSFVLYGPISLHKYERATELANTIKLLETSVGNFTSSNNWITINNENTEWFYDTTIICTYRWKMIPGISGETQFCAEKCTNIETGICSTLRTLVVWYLEVNNWTNFVQCHEPGSSNNVI